MNQYLLYAWLIGGVLAIIALIFILIFFGSLMWLQSRIWLLAKKGFYQIRHIREDKVEKYYYLRISDGKYDFEQGVYISEKDSVTRMESIINKFDYNLLSKKKDTELNAVERETLKFLMSIKNSKVVDITTLSWGIPTVTYYGNNPNPINYSDIKKLHDAKNISALIKRIIMTKEWKLVRMVLILCAIALVAWVALGFLGYNMINGLQSKLNSCQSDLNVTSNKLINQLNMTLDSAVQALAQRQANPNGVTLP